MRDGAGIDNAVTSVLVSDGALVDVGDTLLIGTEQLFVSEKAWTAEENANLINDGSGYTAVKTVTLFTVDDASDFAPGEHILIGSEEMLIVSISGEVLNLVRAVNGTVLEAHAHQAVISVKRTCTVVRGVNGTTAAAALITAAISKYAPPGDVSTFCLAESVLLHKQGKSGWTGEIAGGEAGINVDARGLELLREQILNRYGMVSL